MDLPRRRSAWRQHILSPTAIIAILLAILVVTDVSTGPLSILRAILAVVVIAYVPGLYIVSFSGLDVSRARELYAVGISVIITMAYGYALNTLFLQLGIPFEPFSNAAVLLYVAILTVVAISVPRNPLRNRLGVVESRVRAWPQPYVLGSLLIFGGYLGSYFINNEIGNSLLIGVLVLTGIVAALVIFGDLNRAVTQFLLYATACTLLLQNLVLTPYLARTGDTGFEYYFANQVLSAQVWNPAIYSTKSTSLYLNVFYPLLKLFSGLDLFNVFIYVFPFLFALIAVSLYQIHSSRFGATVAISTVLLYVYTDQFFRLLSRSTRSGMAILFISLFTLALVDSDLATRERKLLVGGFLLSITLIHYGTAIVFGIIVLTAYLAKVLDQLINGVRPWPLNLQTIVLYICFNIGWFVYLGSGRTVDIALFNLYLIARRTGQGQVGASTTAQTATMNLPSYTSLFIRFEYFIVFLIASLTIAGLCLLYLYRTYSRDGWDGQILIPKRGADIMITGRDLALPIGGLGLIAFSFAPTSIFWINRLYMISGVFVLPYLFIGLLSVGSYLPSMKVQSRDVFAVVTVAILLLNTGIVGIFMWNETAHQDTINKISTERNGGDVSQIQLYVNYYPPSDYRASTWLTNHRATDSTVHDNAVPITWLSYFSYINDSVSEPPGPYQTITPETQYEELGDGYIYLNKFVHGRVTDTQPENSARGRFQLPEVITQIERCDRVYTNGDSSVYSTSCRNTTTVENS